MTHPRPRDHARRITAISMALVVTGPMIGAPNLGPSGPAQVPAGSIRPATIEGAGSIGLPALGVTDLSAVAAVIDGLAILIVPAPEAVPGAGSLPFDGDDPGRPPTTTTAGSTRASVAVPAWFDPARLGPTGFDSTPTQAVTAGSQPGTGGLEALAGGRYTVPTSPRIEPILPAAPAAGAGTRRRASAITRAAQARGTGGWRLAAMSWYGPGFYGHHTACGLTLTRGLRGVAHRTLPCGTLVSFRNPRTGATITVPVVDRGPYVSGRLWDLTSGACRAIGMCATLTIGWRIR